MQAHKSMRSACAGSYWSGLVLVWKWSSSSAVLTQQAHQCIHTEKFCLIVADWLANETQWNRHLQISYKASTKWVIMFHQANSSSLLSPNECKSPRRQKQSRLNTKMQAAAPCTYSDLCALNHLSPRNGPMVRIYTWSHTTHLRPIYVPYAMLSPCFCCPEVRVWSRQTWGIYAVLRPRVCDKGRTNFEVVHF